MSSIEKVVLFLFWSIPFFGLLGALYVLAYVYLYHSKLRRKKLKRLKKILNGKGSGLTRLKDFKKNQELKAGKDFS